MVQSYEINKSRPEARSLMRWEVAAGSVGFPHAQQAGDLHRYIDRGFKDQRRQAEEVEREFILTSLSVAQAHAATLLKLDRNYWGIENGLHLRLDVSAKEDKSRVRNRNSAFVLSLFRRAVHSLAAHWIMRQPNKRLATTQGFYDEMSINDHRKAFSLATARKPNWIPKK